MTGNDDDVFRLDTERSFFCAQCNKMLVGKKSYHASTHQKRARTLWDGGYTTLDRASDGKFHCPRPKCKSVSISSWKIGKHLRDCFPSRLACEQALSALAAQHSANDTVSIGPSAPLRPVRNRRPTSRYPIPLVERQTEDDGDALTGHPPEHIGNTTRTERALMRHQFRRHRKTPVTAFREVVKFFGCPPESVWFAIRNRERDDVENDGAYLDGIVGELVNVDLLSDDEVTRPEQCNILYQEKLDDAEDLDEEGVVMDDEIDMDVDHTDDNYNPNDSTSMQTVETTKDERRNALLHTTRLGNLPVEPVRSEPDVGIHSRKASSVTAQMTNLDSGSLEGQWLEKRQNPPSLLPSPLNPSPTLDRPVSGHAATEANLPPTTRTKRALIRQQFRARPDESKHIAQFIGCTRDAFFCAVGNYEHDDMDQDWAYTEGVIGDVVNVDRLIWDASPEPMGNEAIERAQVARKLEETEPWISLDGTLNNDGDGDVQMTLVKDCRVISREMPDSASTRDHHVQTADFAQPIAMHNEEFSHNGRYCATQTATRSRADGIASSSISLSSAQTSSPLPTIKNIALILEPGKPNRGAEMFLGSLQRPSRHLIGYFREMDLDSDDNLDGLCQMEECMWDDVKLYLLGKGVALFQWLIIKNGLRARASGLRASS